jgi:hypothetical protein
MLYVIGGTSTPEGSTGTVIFAPIEASGAVNRMALTSALPSRLSYHEAVVHNGYVYVTGGRRTGEGSTTTVFVAPLASRNTYWGLAVPGGQAGGSYSSTVTYTAVFSP